MVGLEVSYSSGYTESGTKEIRLVSVSPDLEQFEKTHQARCETRIVLLPGGMSGTQREKVGLCMVLTCSGSANDESEPWRRSLHISVILG